MLILLTILVLASIAIMLEAHTKLDSLRYRIASLEDKLKDGLNSEMKNDSLKQVNSHNNA